MRFLFPLLALVAAGLTISIDRDLPPLESRACRLGLCRSDEVLLQIEKNGATAETQAALLVGNPADPAMWCTYGEFLAISGATEKAAQAFDRALELGSGLSRISMRVANFDFTNGREAEAHRLVPIILSQTADFDEILFTYLEQFPVPSSQMLGGEIPNNSRAAQSWFQWVRLRRSGEEIAATWHWMHQNRLDSPESAYLAVQVLWARKFYSEAFSVWREWLGSPALTIAGTQKTQDNQLLTNATFENTPLPIPFDWRLSPTPGIEYQRKDGLEIRFLGTENVDLMTLEQAVAVSPGRYRLALDVSADDLTTGQGPFFRVSDVEDPKRLTVETGQILGSRARGTVSTDFAVSSSTKAVRIQLIRLWSPKLDSKIKGALHIYRASLRPLSEVR